MTTAKSFSNRVIFDFRDFERSHGRKPQFSQNASGWAFVVPDKSQDIIWTQGRTQRELKAEIAAIVKAPVGAIVVAFVQP